MFETVAIFFSILLVAYANGANDNFKGVATLLGSRTANYKKALNWATLTTLAGSFTAIFLATQLIYTFSGRTLFPDDYAIKREFLLAVSLAAGATVFLATRLGVPISTTHSLTGALLGAGWMALGPQLNYENLGKTFLIPLILSPLFSIILTVMIYPLFRYVRKVLGVKRTTCLCLEERVIPIPQLSQLKETKISVTQLRSLGIIVDDKKNCQLQITQHYSGQLLGVDAQQVLDFFHFLSAGAICFARGLNDTPKIVALSVAAGILTPSLNMSLVGIVMAMGGILSAKRVAETMSYRITGMNHGQGFTSNFISACLVILASNWGVPVSTTHVTCGSLFGIGLINRNPDWKMIFSILSAWILTLPLAAFLSAIFYSIFK